MRQNALLLVFLSLSFFFFFFFPLTEAIFMREYFSLGFFFTLTSLCLVVVVVVVVVVFTCKAEIKFGKFMAEQTSG